MDPEQRINAYFHACGHGTADDIADHFTAEATIFDTNIRPVTGAAKIGTMWVKVRERWLGATWHVDSFVGDANGAAIEWRMHGTNPINNQPFTFCGSEHYRFASPPNQAANLISEIRQYWTFDPEHLNTGLVDYQYGNSSPSASNNR